jgi:hypothetical protein
LSSTVASGPASPTARVRRSTIRSHPEPGRVRPAQRDAFRRPSSSFGRRMP